MKKLKLMLISLVMMILIGGAGGGCADKKPDPVPVPVKKDMPRNFVVIPVSDVPGDYFIVNTDFIKFARIMRDECLIIMLQLSVPIKTDNCNELKNFIRVSD